MVATKRKVDMRNVKEGSQFRPKHRPEGDYAAKIVKVDDHTSGKGNEGWVFSIQVEGDARSTYPVYCDSSEKSAWKVRKLLIACGMKVPKSVISFDPNKLVNKALGVFLEDDEYEGKMRSRIQDYMPVGDIQASDDDVEEDDDIDTGDDEEDVDEDEEEEPAPVTKKAKRKPAPVVVEEDDDDEEEEEDEPEPPKPVRRKKAAPAPVVEEDDDDEEEEEPAPAPKRRVKKKAAPKPAVADDDDDDLDLDDL